ncbi:hypothetical protein [Candidatus Nitrospira neomarina]|uniref:Phytanoyl-CoA dioxygenase n=1 Tax=Candidatus Nitrospira neomarina TaxID=3020899 RepID=A0AA96GRK6_9BACT|nr:hypothetical protein [Candidatus Nitrospira neomarina]WNM64008.1 hypothetical protein PQG83_09705 [Candidatus Nitrospira neomarina]
MYYLNDFYIYTDDTFATGWHMDTELFTFEHALNAWILLSSDHVTDPLCFIDQLNDTPDRYYHSLKVDGDDCTFTNFSKKNKTTRSLAAIEQARLHTPTIDVGDILVINPRRFHRTNTSEAKHCLAIKFVYKGPNGLLSTTQVPSMFWPEIGIFNKLVKQTVEWDKVFEGLRGELKTPKGRKALSAGFYPEKIQLYKRMVQTL